jgi:hypothetical protein
MRRAQKDTRRAQKDTCSIALESFIRT